MTLWSWDFCVVSVWVWSFLIVCHVMGNEHQKVFCHSIMNDIKSWKKLQYNVYKRLNMIQISFLQNEKMKCMNIVVLQNSSHALVVVKTYNNSSNKFHLINAFEKTSRICLYINKTLNKKKWSVIRVTSNLCIIKIKTQDNFEIATMINIQNVYNSCLLFTTSVNFFSILSRQTRSDKKHQHPSPLLMETYLFLKTFHEK